MSKSIMNLLIYFKEIHKLIAIDNSIILEILKFFCICNDFILIYNGPQIEVVL